MQDHEGRVTSTPVRGWARLRTSLLWRALAVQKRWVWLALVLFVVNALAILAVTQVTVGMIDQGIVERSEPLEQYLWRILGLAVIGLVVGFLQRVTTTRLSFQLEYDVRMWMYDAVQSASARDLRSVASGQIITRALTDLHLLEQFLRMMPMIVGILPLFIGVGGYMLVLNPFLAVMAMAGLPVNIWLLRRFRTRLWGLSFAEINERAEVTSAIDEPVRGIRVVKAFGREEAERRRVADVALRTYRFAMTRWRLLARFDIPLKAAPVVFQGVLLVFGARLVRSESLTLGTFMLAFQVNAYVVLVANLVDEVASLWQYLRTAQQRIGEVLGFATDRPDTGLDLPEPGDGLRLSEVGLSLGGRRILEDAELYAAPGSTTAVVGAPSSGKTTLAAVASGILRPDAGAVLIDGIPAEDLTRRALRAAVQVASEEPFLLADTVRENLEFGSPAAVDEERLWVALEAAAADDFVSEMTGGLDARLGDRGLTLSGGQRQRIGLARALVNAPRTLVLDDALSAVHPALEADIIRRIRRSYPGMAIVVLSRRNAAATVADHVIELVPAVREEVVDLVPTELARLTADGAAAADVVAALTLSEEAPGPTDAEATADGRPTPRQLAHPFRAVIIAGVAVLAVQTVVKFAPEVFLGEITDMVESGTIAGIDARGALLVFLGVAGAFAAYGFRVLSQRFAQGAMYMLRRRVFQRLSRLGIDFYDREMPGQVAARVVNDLDIVQNFLQQSLFLFFTTLATLVIGLGLVAMLSVQIVPIVLVLVVLLGAIALLQYPVTTKAFNRARDALGQVTTTFEEDFTARDEIHRFGAQDRQRNRFTAQSLELRRSRRWVSVVTAAFADTMQFFSQVAAAVVLYRSGQLVLAGTISIGSALTLRLLATTATQPMSTLSRLYTNFLEVRVSWQRLQEPFDVPVLPVERADVTPCESLAGDICFDRVAFAYPHTGATVLHEISFTVPDGTVAAVVGYTGAGKSSIAKLLMRTYDPDEGVITIGGVDTRDYSVDSFRRRIAVVPQDAFLFTGTIASNIAYGCPDASREEIETAALAVSAYAELSSLPSGFDHPVEEEARNLTAAQRQLVALARAWLTAPDLLVLDEATSCLDARLEQDVLDAVRSLSCTTLMVTHRDNVLDAADQVIVIEAGRVVADGTPSELRQTGGALERLFVITEEAPDAVDAPVPAPVATRSPVEASS